jgi:hypothetical protein
MKMDQNGHDLAVAQVSIPLPLSVTTGQLILSPIRLHQLAKIIDMAEEFG